MSVSQTVFPVCISLGTCDVFLFIYRMSCSLGHTEWRILTQCVRGEHLICTLDIHFPIYLKEQCRSQREAMHVWKEHIRVLGNIHSDNWQISVQETMVIKVISDLRDCL